MGERLYDAMPHCAKHGCFLQVKRAIPACKARCSLRGVERQPALKRNIADMAEQYPACRDALDALADA